MQIDKTATSTRKLQGSTTSDIVGFREYYEAAKDAGSATRNSMYLLTIIIAVVTCVYVNTFGFRFAANRMNKMEIAYQCVQVSTTPGDLHR